MIEELRKRFSAGKVEDKLFKYIGFKVEQSEKEIILDHSEYVENMKTKILDPGRAGAKNELLNEQEQTTYRQIVGQLNWAVQGSRPEMSFDMIQLSTKLKQGKVEDLLRAIKKVNRMKDIKSFLTFPKLNKSSEIKVVVFTDASMGNINDGTGSIGAYIVWLLDKKKHCCPIPWNAH